MRRVIGEATVRWTVDLPDGREREGMACDDPAVEAVVASIPQDLQVFLWGQETPGAAVYLECHEDDVTIEEDGRE